MRSGSAEGSIPKFPDEFLWEVPQGLRLDLFKTRGIPFLLKVVGGTFLGLLFGRVVGSLQGLLLQWIYQGAASRWPWVEASLGRGLGVVGVALGTVVRPLLGGSPLLESFSQLKATSSGSDAVLFLAQLHGTLNGISQGLRPALGPRARRTLERALLSWGLVWHWCTTPLKRLLLPPLSPDRLRFLLAHADDPSCLRALVRAATQGRLPVEPLMPSEAEALAQWPGKIPPEKREALWWTKPSLRAEVYRWIESAKPEAGVALAVRGVFDPDDQAREAAVRALVSLPHLTAVYALLGLAQDPSTHEAAIKALQKLAHGGQSPSAKENHGHRAHRA